MVFAEFIARADADPAIVAYRAAFSPSPFRAKPFAAAALIAFAAETHEEAERLDAPRRAATLAFLEGRQLRFSTIETAQAFLADRRDDPRLAGGFHPIECQGQHGWRWTDGQALLRLQVQAAVAEGGVGVG